MKPPTGKIMAMALRRCRDAEIAWEQKTEIDLSDPRNRKEARGWGLRVNYEGRLGWAWGDVTETPESLLERSIQSARSSAQEGILFAHGLPFSGNSLTPEPMALEPHLDRLARLVGRLQFLLPSMVKDRATRIRAGLRWQMLTLVTRAGEQSGQRILYQATVDAPESPVLRASILAARLRSSPTELLCELAWQAAHSDQVSAPAEGFTRALLTSAATAALITDLVSGHFDSRRFKDHPELAAPWGEHWLANTVTIQDDATLQSGPGSVPFDGEGQPRRAVSLVHDGVVHHHLADRLHARQLGVDAPGLAVRDWGQPPMPGWSNLSMLGGRSSLGELAKEMGDGVLLDRLVPCDAPCESDEFCRLAEVAFLVKGGRPIARLTPMVVKGNFCSLLGKDLIGIGGERAWSGRTLAPPLAVGALRLERPNGATAQSEPPSQWW
jgi:predicted Zn-dependent protease